MIGLRSALRRLLRPAQPFDYIAYWQQRYALAGNSGAGSYGLLADYKAAIVNAYLRDHAVESVIEFGVGDGNQLTLMRYPRYLGLDVAPASLARCRQLFADDPTKSFMLYQPQAFVNRGFLRADLVVCLDVLYHITDEADFRKTLDDIISCAPRHIVLYTQLYPTGSTGSHITERDLAPYLAAYHDFRVTGLIGPHASGQSSASFIFLERIL